MNTPLQVHYNGYYGVDEVWQRIPVTGRVNYQMLNNEGQQNGGQTIAPGNDPDSPNYVSDVNTDWQDVGLQKGMRMDHNLRFINVTFGMMNGNQPYYSVSYHDSVVLDSARLGLVRGGFDFSHSLSLKSISGVHTVYEHYTMLHGKQSAIDYPGNLNVTVTYTLTNDNELKIDYKATPVNLTNHSYFNLNGHPDSTVLDHQLKIDANSYTLVNDELIPTGEMKSVKGTPFDILEFHKIGARIKQVKGGYDHNFVLNRSESDSLFHAATVYQEATGREMNVYTTQPGVQFYSGNFLDSSLNGPDVAPFVKHGALCLETQHFPNSPNEPDFPSTILRPGEQYHQGTIYQFSTSDEQPKN